MGLNNSKQTENEPVFKEDTHIDLLNKFINSIPKDFKLHIYTIEKIEERVKTPVNLWVHRKAGRRFLRCRFVMDGKFETTYFEEKEDCLLTNTYGKDIRIKFKRCNQENQFIVGMIMDNTEEEDYILVGK
jgi:hypothetical protein